MAVLAAAGCGTSSDRTNSLVALAGAGMPVYSVGTEFEGMRLRHVEVHAGSAVELGYGPPTCHGSRWNPFDLDYCDYPLMITTYAISKARPLIWTSASGEHDCWRTTVRGVPAVRFTTGTPGPAIFTGSVRVDLNTAPSRLRAVAQSLRLPGEARGGYALPAPPAWVRQGIPNALRGLSDTVEGVVDGCPSDASVLSPIETTVDRLRASDPEALYLGAEFRGRWLDSARRSPWGLEFTYSLCGTSTRPGCWVSRVTNLPIASVLDRLARAGRCRSRVVDGSTVLDVSDAGRVARRTIVLSGRYAVELDDAEPSALRPLGAQPGTGALPQALESDRKRALDACTRAA